METTDMGLGEVSDLFEEMPLCDPTDRNVGICACKADAPA